MPGRTYSQQDLEKLLTGVRSGASLYGLEQTLGRPPTGIVKKLEQLSEIDPATWDPEQVKRYQKEWGKLWYEDHKEAEKAGYKEWYYDKGGKEWCAQYAVDHKDKKRESVRRAQAKMKLKK